MNPSDRNLRAVTLPPNWAPESWRSRPAVQMPTYPDAAALESALGELRQLPPLVTSWEIFSLKKQLAEAQEGKRFLLQGGDCAETSASGACTNTRTADASSARLSTVTSLSEGATLAAGERGRAVVTLRPGWALDLRPGATAGLQRLRENETLVALSGGEARVEPSGELGDDPGVRLRSGRWTVTAHGPATVRDEVSTLRVVVLSGRATFEAEGVAPMQVTGPVVFDLPATGDPRAVQGEASDPAAIALASLSGLGELFSLPALSPGAALSFAEGGALPAALEAVRVRGPATIQAREGGRLMRLEIGTGRVLRWTPVGATVAAAAPRPRVTAPTPTAPDPVQVEEQQRLRAWTGSAVRRIGSCFTRCRETNRCPDASGFIELVVSPNRAPVTVGAIDPAFVNARSCVEGQAPSIPPPDVREVHAVRIPIHGTQR